MKQISYWAKEHPWAARIIIIACYIGINITGLITGYLLNELSLSLSSLFLFIVILIFLAGVISYPSRTWRGSTLSKEACYVRRKSFDFLLIACTFFMIVYCGNHFNQLPLNFATSEAAIVFTPARSADSSVKGYKSIESFKASMKNSEGKKLKWKARKKLLKKQLNEIEMAPELSTTEKILLTILSLAIAFGLFYLLAALSCSISCGGAEGLAIVVAVVGLAAIVLLLVWAFRKIYRKRDLKSPPKQNDSTPKETNGTNY